MAARALHLTKSLSSCFGGGNGAMSSFAFLDILALFTDLASAAKRFLSKSKSNRLLVETIWHGDGGQTPHILLLPMKAANMVMLPH